MPCALAVALVIGGGESVPDGRGMRPRAASSLLQEGEDADDLAGYRGLRLPPGDVTAVHVCLHVFLHVFR